MRSLLKKAVVLAMSALLVISLVSNAFADTAIDTIFSVGTTQAFTDEAVPDEDLATILKAGLAAASAINQQPWHFVAVTNKDIMSEISGSSSGFTPPSFPGGAMPPMPGNADGNVPSAPPANADGKAPAVPPAMGGAKAGFGDSPVAIIIYMNENTASPNANFDCGLAAQNMYIAAASLGYGVKIVSSTTMALNGENHDAICEKLGIDTSLKAVAVLLIGHADTSTDATASPTTRDSLEAKTTIVK